MGKHNSSLSPEEKLKKRRMQNKNSSQKARDRLKKYIENLKNDIENLKKENENLQKENENLEKEIQGYGEIQQTSEVPSDIFILENSPKTFMGAELEEKQFLSFNESTTVKRDQFDAVPLSPSVNFDAYINTDHFNQYNFLYEANIMENPQLNLPNKI